MKTNYLERFVLKLVPTNSQTELFVIVFIKDDNGAWVVATPDPVAFERLAHPLQSLLDYEPQQVEEIEKRLKAGEWVPIDAECLREHLEFAGFIQA